MRNQKSIVAIVQDANGNFLVTYNAKWGGYAFPMISLTDEGDLLGSLAIQAVEKDLGAKLTAATATELDYMSHFGISQRTGEETLYEYWLYIVKPNQTLDLLAAPSWNNNPARFLSFAELTTRTDLTWSTPAIVRQFVENQNAVLSVVTRAGKDETEFLLIHNESYDGFFFPSQRVKTEVKPEKIAVGTIRSDLGYRGPALAEYLGDIADSHHSNRFQRQRKYQFHVCEVRLPELDLHQPTNPLERAIRRREKEFLWVPGSRFDDPKNNFSPTMSAVGPSVRRMIPARTFAGSLRQSEGGIALIERNVNGKRQWLSQWNEKWKAFFFVGGHREAGESFRDCVIREIEEELKLTASEFTVAHTEAAHLEYRAISRSAGELTDYVMELFPAQLNPAAHEKVAQNPLNKWVSETEILHMEASDARPVSVSMGVILDQMNELPSEQ